MLKGLVKAFGTIGEGWASIMNACAGTSRFDDYKHLMPRGRDVKLLTPEEVLSADRKAIQGDRDGLVQWKDIGQWSDIGKQWPWGGRDGD